MPLQEFRFFDNGEQRIAKIEGVIELRDGSQVVSGIAYDDIYGNIEFLPELEALSSYMNFDPFKLSTPSPHP